MPSGRGLTVWLLVAVVLWSSCGFVIRGDNSNALPQRPQTHNSQNHEGTSQKHHLPIPYQNKHLPNPVKRDNLSHNYPQRKLQVPPVRRRPVRSTFSRDYLKQKRQNLLSILASGAPVEQRRSYPYSKTDQQDYVTQNQKHEYPQDSNSIYSKGGALENVFGPWLKKRSGFRSEDAKETEEGDGDPSNKKGQNEMNSSLKQVGSSINRAFFRSTRSGPRPWDVPQIGE